MPVGVRLRGYILPYLSSNPLSSPASPWAARLDDDTPPRPRPPSAACPMGPTGRPGPI
nr:MAG TPA: hypothetical protein [Caudoviricetes sp.]